MLLTVFMLGGDTSGRVDMLPAPYTLHPAPVLLHAMPFSVRSQHLVQPQHPPLGQPARLHLDQPLPLG